MIEHSFYTNAEKGLPWDDLFNSHNKYIFHYTTLDTALRYILRTRQLRLGPYANTNDPRESKDWEFTWFVPDSVETIGPSRVPDSVWAELGDRANTIGKHVCRVLCTTQDDPQRSNERQHFGRGYCHPRMWAQYAGEHSGACLVLDKELLNSAITETLTPLGQVFSGQVRYADHTKHDLDAFELDYSHILKEGIETVMKRKLAQFRHTYFFQKALDWQQEQEYRWVLIGDNNTPEYVRIDISTSLKYMIVGMKCAKEHWPSITVICEEQEVPVGQLIWRSGQPFFTGSVTSALLKAAYRSR